MILPVCLYIQVNAEDGKLGADHFAEIAVYTFPGLDHHGWMVAFGVEFIGHLKHVLRAVLTAKSTSFASVNDDFDFTTGNLDLVEI